MLFQFGEEKHLNYSQSWSMIAIQSDARESYLIENNFISIVHTAVGCSDLIPPEDAWLKRTENSAIVGCYTSRQTWHLKCEDRRWIGVVSNCTQCQQRSFISLLSFVY